MKEEIIYSLFICTIVYLYWLALSLGLAVKTRLLPASGPCRLAGVPNHMCGRVATFRPLWEMVFAALGSGLCFSPYVCVCGLPAVCFTISRLFFPSALYSAIQRCYCGGATRGTSQPCYLLDCAPPTRPCLWQSPSLYCASTARCGCARSPARLIQVLHKMHTWLGRVFKASSLVYYRAISFIWCSGLWASPIPLYLVW